MKKWIIFVLAILLLTALLTMHFTSGFTKNVISGKIYRPQNVYEEIWNLVVTEEHTTKQTVLTTSTKDADVDFDFGYEFVGIHIPECNVTIGWWNNTEDTELSFLFSNRLDGDGDYVHFVYNYKTKTLFGNTEFSFLFFWKTF